MPERSKGRVQIKRDTLALQKPNNQPRIKWGLVVKEAKAQGCSNRRRRTIFVEKPLLYKTKHHGG
jgi:hypothetical protein